MKTNKLFKTFTILVILAPALVSSCNEEEDISQADTQDISEEAVTDSYFQDLDDMAGVAIMSGDETNGGRVASGSRDIVIQDHRFNCDGVVVTLVPAEGSTTDVPQGTITVDFGTAGCTDLKGNVRKGKIVFTYHGRRFQPGSTIVTTVEDYYINDIKLEGVRTITNASASTSDAPAFHVQLENGKAIFEDGSFASRQSNITVEWVRASNPADDRLVIDVSSTASGTNRRERTYEVSLLEPLEFKRFCGFAVKGIKKYLIDGEREIIVDYGDGECDRSVTVTVDGVTQDITVDD